MQIDEELVRGCQRYLDELERRSRIVEQRKREQAAIEQQRSVRRDQWRRLLYGGGSYLTVILPKWATKTALYGLKTSKGLLIRYTLFSLIVVFRNGSNPGQKKRGVTSNDTPLNGNQKLHPLLTKEERDAQVSTSRRRAKSRRRLRKDFPTAYKMRVKFTRKVHLFRHAARWLTDKLW